MGKINQLDIFARSVLFNVPVVRSAGLIKRMRARIWLLAKYDFL